MKSFQPYFLIFLLFLLCMTFSACKAEKETTEPHGTDSAPSDILQTEEKETPSSPAETAENAVTETEELPQTEADMPQDTSAVFENVSDDYFSDALFIGDSHTDGLRMCAAPGDALFYAGTSMSVYSLMDSKITVDGCRGLKALLESRSFGKIYFMLGVNEAGYAASSFLEQYKEVLTEIRSYQPEAIIYMQSILPVTSSFAAENPIFSKENLNARNEGLSAYADGISVYYLNVSEAFANSYGALPSEYTDDGVHLKAEYYSIWRDYLYSHAVIAN